MAVVRNLMRLLLILAVGFIACTQQNPTPKTKSTDTLTAKSADTPALLKQQPQDTITTFDSTIYSQYISAEVMRLINHHLPQWYLPAPGNWDAFWFKEYKKDSVLVNYITGDFNCDGKKDYSLLLANAKEGFAVWVLQSAKETYEAIKLVEFGQMERPVEVGLQFTEVGELNYLYENAEDVKSVTLKCPAISVLYFEKAAVTYYWENGKYVEVQTGD